MCFSVLFMEQENRKNGKIFNLKIRLNLILNDSVFLRSGWDQTDQIPYFILFD